MNKLYFGDCLTVMGELMRSASVDLIYLDPPFNSCRDYSVIYKDETGRPLPDQIRAFSDQWTLTAARREVIKAMPIILREAGIDHSAARLWQLWMNALADTQPQLLAYLTYMVERLLQMKVVLKPTGSLYLHCDPTVSHYIKAMLDAIFGHTNFRNEIIWKRTSAHSSAKRFGPVHDTIFLYTRSDTYTWNPIFQPYDQSYIDSFYRHSERDGRQYRVSDLTGAGIRHGESGEPWRDHDPTAKGRHWAVPRSFTGGEEVPEGVIAALDHLDSIGRIHWPAKAKGVPGFKRYLADMEGMHAQDVIPDIAPVTPHSKERMGYATQKPVELLERFILASSDPGEVVFDPFCGCATTLEAAHRLGRRWIGIDIAYHAVKRVARVRLGDRCGLIEGQDFEIEGIPQTTEGARDLWSRDKYHFQCWAVAAVDGFVTEKQSADGGVDGRLYFYLPNDDRHHSMAIEVKGGKSVNISVMRELRGVLERDDALLAGLILLEPLGPTKQRNFGKEIAEAGTLDVAGTSYRRLQILTVDEIFEGKRFDTPSVVGKGLGQPTIPGISA